MKKGILTLVAVGLAGVLAAGAALAVNAESGASGCECGLGQRFERGKTTMLDLLGLTPEEFKEKIDEGMNMEEIVEEQGLSMEELHAKKMEMMRERWQEMGLSEEEVADREARMQERFENHDFSKPLPFKGRFGQAE